MKNTAFVLLFFCFAFGCGFDGEVEQGRCVAFNPTERTATIAIDKSVDYDHPHYSGEIRIFKLPDSLGEMGPEPAAGGRLMMEIDKNIFLYYDPETKTVNSMPVEYLGIQKNITSMDARLKNQSFPVIDTEKRTVTIYSPRLESLVTLRVPAYALSFPAYFWEDGDEVRIASRKNDKNTAIRFMNVTKTNIFSR